jgi:hypothetical protein
MNARCRGDGSREFVAVANLTADGCCIMTKQPCLTKGAWVTVQPETLSSLRSQVQWTSGCFAGLRFENPLYGPVYEHLARTFWRPDAASLYHDPADGGDPAALAALTATLLRQIEEAEARSLLDEAPQRTVYQRPLEPARRPAIGLRRPRKGVELWLS